MKVARTVRRGQGTCERPALPYEGRRVMNRTTTKKKMAFLLMRLITIFALAFVASSAMASEFDVTLDMTGDVSTAGGLQLAHPGTSLVVTVKFDRAVVFAASNAFVTTYDEDGDSLGFPAATSAPATASQEIALTIPVTAAVAKVNIKIAKGIASADPINADTSQEGNWDIYLVNGFRSPIQPLPLSPVVVADQVPPTVYSIERVDNPLLPVTADTVQIIITLSEMPRAFTKDHVSVSNATHDGPVALEAIPETDNMPSTGHDGKLYPYVLTITPKYENTNDIVVKVKAFEDTALPTPNRYTPPSIEAGYRKGTDKLAVKVNTEVLTAKNGGSEVVSGQDTTIPTTVADAATVSDATPTATTTTPAATEAAPIATTEKAPAVDTSVPIPEDGQIYISEIMFAKSGTLPQWIEISNGSRTEQVNLSDWTLTVENATADADVSVGAKAVFTIPEGTRIDPSGQHDTPSTVLVVTEQGRTNLGGWMADGQVINLWTDQQLELFRLDIFKRRYSLLSDMAFKITLAPPAALITTPAAADATDVVGNLGVDGTATWTLPMAEGHARSSIIRRHVAGSVGPAEPKDGEKMESWVLASDTGFGKPMHLSTHSYYGLPIDIGTPGFRAGGALPVELSQFRPVRDKETGAVVITWSTQSELNNAGFFIKRSQQRDGQFKVINAAMIPGAGTTSEKQFYTYTDTTAQANVVYYYQIEDVSLDGNRQTLTRGIRLRGHIGAAGKETTLWGALKRTN